MTSPDQPTAPAPRGLNPVQLDYLLRPIDPRRVKLLKGQSHLEAWDVRRHLTRYFGFGGWSYTTDMVMVSEASEQRRKRNREGQEYGDPYAAWTVVYRAKVRLVVRDPYGNELAHFEEYAAGDSVNQPSRGDAHDNAMKTAESQALKRAATNLGDGFGLSLYADGSTAPVVQATLDQMEQKKVQEQPAEEAAA